MKIIFQKEGSLYISCNGMLSSPPMQSCQKVCEALTFLLDNIYIRYDSRLYRQIADILMGIRCASLVNDLLLFCYMRDFMLSLSNDNQSEVIETFINH